MVDPTAYILCRFAEKSAIYNTWMEHAPVTCKVVDEYLPDWPLPGNAALIITHMHYRWEEIAWLRQAYESGRVAILILADGILEYRNTWEHPDLAAGAIFQPVMGHKLACIGRGQARVVESWGNVGKCEVVGLPRFDSLPRVAVQERQPDRPFRLLIATANTPAFNDVQRQTVIESLQHILARMNANPKVNGRPVEITWRLTDGLDRELGLPEVEEDPPPLGSVIQEVDAVITTPSTLYLESIYQGRPTAILDFHNSPHYVQAAWFINAPKHFNWILSELENPPRAKLMFQESVLANELECRTPATPRLYQLIEQMAAATIRSARSGQPITLPPRILADPLHGFAPVAETFDPAELFPDNEVFRNPDRQRLQVELSQAIQRLETLPRELREKNQFLGEALEALDRSRARVAQNRDQLNESHERVLSLRQRLAVFKRKLAEAEEAAGRQPSVTSGLPPAAEGETPEPETPQPDNQPERAFHGPAE